MVALKALVARLAGGLVRPTVARAAHKLAVLQGAVASRQVRAIESVERLADVEFSVCSQWGEDGIIEWLVHHNGPMPETFIEFGVENYEEANTRFLLESRNWRGLIIDGSADHMQHVRENPISDRHDLTAVARFIDKDNIDTIFEDAGFSGEIGLLSVDIDGNDFWVWQAITSVNPHFVVAEYNSAFGDIEPLSVPYAADFVRSRAHHSNLYYGASIEALARLATRRGYRMLGVNSAGSNVFFVREDRAHRFEGRIRDISTRPSRFRESRDASGRLTFVSPAKRVEAIGDCPVTDVETGTTRSLGTYGRLFSDEWLDLLNGRAPRTGAHGAPGAGG